MDSLFLAHDVMKWSDNMLTHVVKENSMNTIVKATNQMIGGDYLCGGKGSITEISSGIGSWVQLEDIITVAGTGVYSLFCKECLNEASFILGVTSD